MKLRPYQVADVDRLRDAMRRTKRVLYVLPTGGGKTVVFAHIAASAAAKGKTVLILVHRRELVRQTVAKLADEGIDCGLITASTMRPRQVTVAAVQTLARRTLDYVPDLYVVDEAHHAVAGTWKQVLEGAVHVLGVTATPERLDGAGLGEMFDDMVRGPEVDELVADGFLAASDCYERPGAVADLKGIRKSRGDYSRGDLEELMMNLQVTQAAVTDYIAMGEERPAFAFCVGRDHAAVVASAYEAASVPAASIDGTMKTAERDAVLRRFGAGEVKVLASCDLLTEGFDAPAAAVAVLLRPTTSLAMHRQIIGRVLRPKPDGGRALILDYSRNIEAHGPPGLVIDWSLKGSKGTKKKPIQARKCPECGYLLAATETFPCPKCGFVRISEEVEFNDNHPGELTRIEIENLPYRALVERANSLPELRMIAMVKGYKRGWAMHVARGKGLIT